MTTTTALQALPCPFCGSAQLEAEHTESYVFCRGCRASGPYTSKQGPAASIEAWNERAALSAAQDAPADEQVAEIYRLIDKYGDACFHRCDDDKTLRTSHLDVRDAESALKHQVSLLAARASRSTGPLSAAQQDALMQHPGVLSILADWHDCQQVEGEAFFGRQLDNAEGVRLRQLARTTYDADPEIWPAWVSEAVGDKPTPAQDAQRCIDARNKLNVALHGEGAVIDSLEDAVDAAVRRLSTHAQDAAATVPSHQATAAVISLGSALHRISTGNYDGAAKVIARVREMFSAAAPTAAQPVPERLLQALERSGLRAPTDLDDAISMAANVISEDRTIIDSLEAKAAQAPALVPLTDAARDVLAERQRQVNVEGWTPEHDDAHGDENMAFAAACYTLSGSRRAVPGQFNTAWLWKWTGWSDKWFKPRDRRRNLVKAGALILAEIERLDRAGIGTTATKEQSK